jgi:hypothetical protein
VASAAAAAFLSGEGVEEVARLALWGHVSFWPILLKKSFLAKNPFFSEALVRSWKNYVRAHMSTLTSNRRAL